MQELNIGKEIRELSYVEKRLIMVISLTQQLANAQGDLARTIESPANQLKILQQQLDRLRLALGRVINVFLQKMLPVLNGFVMALVEVINLVAELLEKLTGFENTSIDYGSVSGIGDEVGEIIDGMEEADEKVEDLKKNMLGIDELNILEPQESESPIEGIDPTILNAFEKALENWDNMMESVNMRAYAIRDSIMDMLGLEPTEDGWGLKEGASLARTVKDIIDSIDTEKLEQGFWNISKAIGAIIVGTLAFKVLLNPAVLLATGLYLVFTSVRDIIDEGSLSLENFQKLLGGISALLLGLGIMFFNPTLAIIGAIGLAITALLNNLSDEQLSGIFNFFKDIFEKIGEALKWIWENAELIGAVVAVLGVGLYNPIIAAIGLVILLVKSLSDETSVFGNAMKNLWNDVIKPIWTALVDNLKRLWEKLKPALVHLWELLKGLWDIISIIIKVIVDLFGPAVGALASVFVDILGGALGFIIDLLDALIVILGGIIDFIAGVFTGDLDRCMKGLGNIVIGVLNLIISAVEAAVNLIVDLVNAVLGLLLGAIKGLWNTIAGVIETIAKVAGFNINIHIKGDILKIPKLKIPRVPTFANGGYPNKGVFMMNEGSSAEMLGTINGRTAVANNDQIAGALANALAPLLGTVVTAVENVAASDRPIVLYADSREIARASQKGSRKLGYNPIGGEFANV